MPESGLGYENGVLAVGDTLAEGCSKLTGKYYTTEIGIVLSERFSVAQTRSAPCLKRTSVL